jgi:Flp pilus assembly protein TadG
MRDCLGAIFFGIIFVDDRRGNAMFRKLWRNEDGQAIMMITIMLPVLFGFVGLAIDGVRFASMHTELQNLADAAALAGAKKLDGTSNAIDNATAAANSLSADNAPTLSNVAADGVQIGTPVFYQYLAGDADPVSGKTIASDVVTTDPTLANYIKVTTIQRSIDPLFLVAVGLGQAGTTATATAGSTFVACNVQPLMLCNPNDPNAFTATAGDLWGFTATGNTGGYSPGDFSLLDPANGKGSAPAIANLLAASSPNACYVNTLSPAQGQKTVDVASGINVRFDINPTGNPKNMDQTPAPNVVKGDDTNACMNSNQVSYTQKNPPLNAATAMPLVTSTTPIGSALQGGGFDTANANSYYAAHHPTATWPTNTTRYSVYLDELNGNFGAGTSGELQVKAPTCTGVSAGTASRRVISIAIVDCKSQNISGNSNKVIFSKQYAEFFLVRPVADDGIIWAEFIRFMTPASSGTKLKQIVQLVRDQ